MALLLPVSERGFELRGHRVQARSEVHSAVVVDPAVERGLEDRAADLREEGRCGASDPALSEGVGERGGQCGQFGAFAFLQLGAAGEHGPAFARMRSASRPARAGVVTGGRAPSRQASQVIDMSILTCL